MTIPFGGIAWLPVVLVLFLLQTAAMVSTTSASEQHRIVQLGSGYQVGSSQGVIFQRGNIAHNRRLFAQASPSEVHLRSRATTSKNVIPSVQRAPLLIHVSPSHERDINYIQQVCRNPDSILRATSRALVLLDTIQTLHNLLSLPGVAWVGPLLPKYKLSEAFNNPSRSSYLWKRLDTLRIHLFPNSKVEAILVHWRQHFHEDHVSFEVRSTSTEKIGHLPSPTTVTAKCGEPQPTNHSTPYIPCSQLVITYLSQDVNVIWIEPRAVRRPLNNYATKVLQSGAKGQEPYTSVGLNGTGEIASSADSGIDYDHCFFHDPNVPVPIRTTNFAHRKIVRYDVTVEQQNFPDPVEGHGTHTMGSLCGSVIDLEANPNGRYHGVAPGAKVAFLDVQSASGDFYVPEPIDTQVYQPHWGLGARIYSQSWGSLDFTYNSDCAETDSFSYQNPEFVGVFAAGNEADYFCQSGDKWPCDAYTLSSPGTAKNALSVGSSMQPHLSWLEQGTVPIRLHAPPISSSLTSSCVCNGAGNPFGTDYGSYCKRWDGDCTATGWCYVNQGIATCIGLAWPVSATDWSLT